jgi:Spy/CpxP family protein refolding chaperone
MITFVRSLVTVASLGLATALATSIRADGPAPQSHMTPSAESDEAAHAGGGLVQLVDEALSKIQLRQEQKAALEKVGADVGTSLKSPEQAKGALLAALVEPIRAGKVDAAALDDEIEAVADAAKQAAPTMRGALEKLHASLDPAQRTAFVEAFDKGLRQRLREGREMKWADEIGMNDEQKEKVRAIIAEKQFLIDAVVGRLTRVMAAFDGEDFPMNQIAAGTDVEECVERLAKALVAMTGRVVDLLTPDQRKRLADKIAAATRTSEGPAPTVISKSPSAHEGTGTTSSALWAGGYRAGGVGYGGGVGYARGYGYAGGVVNGMGYVF